VGDELDRHEGNRLVAAGVRGVVRLLVGVASIAIIALGVAAGLLRPRPVAVTWVEIPGNFVVYSSAVSVAGDSFGSCQPYLGWVGRRTAIDPPGRARSTHRASSPARSAPL
jgi:hypothetical protein